MTIRTQPDTNRREQLAPTSGAERIVSLDLLRGFAVLGILVMNIQAFSMIDAAYLNPTAFGSLEGANFWVWLLSHLFFDMKFMAIFSMLFGAGVSLMWQRACRAGRSFFGLHYRRMFWLIFFGLCHAYLLWYGDILFYYGVCGLGLYFFRRLRPRTLLMLGLALLLVGSSIYLLAGLSMPHWPPEQLEEFGRNTWAPPPDRIAEKVENYRGSWSEQMKERVPAAAEMQTFVLFFFFLWRAGGLMLIGMALFKLGVFSSERTRRFYGALVAVGALVGLPIVAYGVSRNLERNWDPSSFFLGSQYNYWGSLLVSLGWVGVVILVARKGWVIGLQRRLVAVGRMALTGYLLQTLLCTTIFYGHGFALYGQVSRVVQVLIVVSIWGALLLFSPWWLKRFRYGPFEWLWRSLSYWSLLPIQRSSA